MKKIYLVRHGEAVVNLATMFLEDEGGLTEKGQKQARLMAERAVNLKPEAIVCSTMQRTRETVAPIAERTGLAVEYSDLFVERRIPAEFWGKDKHDPSIHDRFQKWLAAFYDTDVHFESSDDFAKITQRARDALAYVHGRPEDTILVVTHGYFLRVLLATVMFGDSLTPQELRKFVRATSTEHTGISELRHVVATIDDVDPGEARWKIRVYNDHAHLG